jgi:hypothetical protein
MAAVDRVRERLQGARERLDRARTGGDRGGGVREGQGFDPARVGIGERVAAISALALLLLMLLDWFGGRNAWQLKWIDLVLFATALLVIALAVTEAIGREQVARDTAAVGLTVAGAGATGIMVAIVFESTGGTVPLVLALFASGGILYGGLLALRPPPRSSALGGSLRGERPPPPESRPFDRDSARF